MKKRNKKYNPKQFGRLDDGTPFMCLCADVEVVE